MYLKLAIALIPIAIILLVSEYLWRKKIIRGERARKFIHILAGIHMAFWPHYIPFDGIFILGCLALTVLIYSRYTKMFHAMYAVKRITYGEIFYAGAIAFCAYYAQEPWIFTISILLMALADGGAAVVGRFWGRNNEYLVFGQTNLRKSIAGTAAYVLLAYVSIFSGWLVGGEEVIRENYLLALGLLPLGSAILENFSPYGLDNFFTPAFATLLLNSLL